VLPILHAVAGLLERAQIIEPEALVRGYVGEQLITVVLTMKSEGSLTEQWTEARVAAPDGLLLWVQPPSLLEKIDRKQGRAVGTLVGDREFDAALLVMGAPERMVQQLFDDEEIRRGVLALAAGKSTAALTTTRPAEHVPTMTEGTFVLKIPDWVEDLERAALLIRTTARLGAVGAELAQLQRAQDPSDYRGQLVPARQLRDEQEVRELRLEIARRDRRATWLERGAVCIAVLVFVGFAGAMLWLGCGAAK
jgi:hypothetical protein